MGPDQTEELEKLLQYMLRPPVSLRRLEYGSDGMVTYRGKYNPALRRDHQHVTSVEFLAMLVPHIQLKFQCAIHYYGALSTTLRKRFGWINPEGSPPQQATSVEEDSDFVRQRKKNWARLIAKTWIEEPELCPRCGHKMRVLAAISSPAQDDVIEKILKSVALWDPPWKRERKIRGPPRQPEIFEITSLAEAEFFQPSSDEDFTDEDLNQDSVEAEKDF